MNFLSLQDIDVKRQGAISAYSFIQFTDIRSVVKALRALDGETMGGMKLKVCRPTPNKTCKTPILTVGIFSTFK